MAERIQVKKENRKKYRIEERGSEEVIWSIQNKLQDRQIDRQTEEET